MLTKIFTYTFVLLLLFNSLLSAAPDELQIHPVKEKIKVQPGGREKIVLRLVIPEKSYIYGNPKGPGTGRPTTVEIEPVENISFEAPVYSKPEKYKAKADPDFVWIYKKETLISLPFDVNKNILSGEYIIPVKVTALLCTDRSCTLHNFDINYPVIITDNGKNTTPANSKAEKNNTAQNKILQERDKAAPYDLSLIKPRFISTMDISGIIQAIIYGLLAGFFLNFMPCVLPVISLKIMDLINFSGQDRSKMRKTGFVFTLGILTSFAFLAALVSFLGYSWGGLFQHNLFLVIMIAIVFALALSMFNVFTINIPSFAGKISNEFSNNYAGSFSKGLLVTLLATPCSGPFLGGTLAWASTQTPAIIFIIFFSIGIGMALPYLILTTNPKLIRFIPKPGNWMITFENIMAFLLLGTVVYFVGILKESLIMPTIWFLMFIAIAAWQYGKYGAINMARKMRIISRIAAVLIIICGYFLSFNYFYGREPESGLIETNKREFTISLLYDNMRQGRITIVDFTADWCPNCKLVEETSLYTTSVANAIKSGNIELMVADMTRMNTDAKKMLDALGSRSIPFLAVFPAGESFFKPVCLRDIYSENDVLKAIEIALSKEQGF
ncbi:MAG: thioredoxin family protein [Spirochaetes bacterium]|nr:thioredoxin family protein [Spirochaetota bacterium]